MITLRCTQKLLRRLGPLKVDAAAAAPTNALGDWYVNLLHIGRDQVVMATSERSLLTVLLPARELRAALIPNLAEMTWHLLLEIGIPPDRAATEAEEMRMATIGRTASRSVLASMNNFALSVDWHWYSGRRPMDIMLLLAGTPMRSIPEGKHDFEFPRDVARRLLGS